MHSLKYLIKLNIYFSIIKIDKEKHNNKNQILKNQISKSKVIPLKNKRNF